MTIEEHALVLALSRLEMAENIVGEAANLFEGDLIAETDETKKAVSLINAAQKSLWYAKNAVNRLCSDRQVD